jgi:acyl dehydratase|tara:strand:- start:540 stop:950 length:411 start_codon:yes stop_codon:yes gene_type:complete
MFDITNIIVGHEIPEVIIEPLQQQDLIKYAKASGDYNPIHLDKNFANNIGLDNVIVHGMLIMAHLGKSIANSMTIPYLKHFSVQFSSITTLGEKLICSGQVIKIEKDKEKKIISLNLKVLNLSNDVKILGRAIFST